jgi:spore coat protein CotF
VWHSGHEKTRFQLTLKSRSTVKVEVTSENRTPDVRQVLGGIRDTKKTRFQLTLKSRSTVKVEATSENRTQDVRQVLGGIRGTKNMFSS